MAYGNKVSSGSLFDKHGHPGRYTTVYTHKGGEQYFTGSHYGYGAVLVGSGSTANTNGGYVTLTGSGSIQINELRTFSTAVGELNGHIIDLSCRYVSSSTAEPNCYFFKRQQ